jgi:hypothetical protein
MLKVAGAMVLIIAVVAMLRLLRASASLGKRVEKTRTE